MRSWKLKTAGLALAACALTPAAAWATLKGSGWSMPHDASEHGHLIASLINTTLLLTSILFVIMCGWLAITFLKHNKQHEAVYDHGDSPKSVRMTLLVCLGVLGVVDGNLEYNSSVGLNGTFWNFKKVEENKDTLRIEINARQWIWQARYAGADSEFNTEDDALLTNDIRVPVDTPIYLQLASPDVIHSFYLPNFRLKQDAMPGMINKMWFQAKETGSFDIACAQHCGANHYLMKGTLTVLPKAEFAEWLRARSTDSKKLYEPTDTEANWGWKWRK